MYASTIVSSGTLRSHIPISWKMLILALEILHWSQGEKIFLRKKLVQPRKMRELAMMIVMMILSFILFS